MVRTSGKSAAHQPPAGAKPGSARQLTCFVVTGFGNKTDYSTGRVLNLDKTYEQLVRPACDKVNVNCFRAIDANLTGSIDSIMYRWIYQADIVIADLSTLNANVFYELGVRHAQKPNTTVIIAESVLVQRIPFDLSSFVVHKYEHGGEQISAHEQEVFVKHLSEVLAKLIAVEQRRRLSADPMQAESDSPVFKHLIGMTPPGYTEQSYIEPPVYVPPTLRKASEVKEGETLASIIDAAECAKQGKRFQDAIHLFNKAIAAQAAGKKDAKPDPFLAQRLALVTYKHGEQKDAQGHLDKTVAVAALVAAQQILAQYCEPGISTDPETLGLSGAINKRLFQLTDDLQYLHLAIRFYERGFYVKQDYYNGINVAYMYNQLANRQDSRFDAIVSYGHANLIRRLVVGICEQLISQETAFAQRGDQEWVYMSLAEAFQGLDRQQDGLRLAPLIDSVASPFGKQTYLEQKASLQQLLDDFRARVRPEDLDQAPALRATLPAVGAVTDAAASNASPEPARAADTTGLRPITVDADVAPGRTVKSIEINCKIEYF